MATVAKAVTINTSGQLTDGLKVWMGTTTTTTGDWSVNYAAAGFTSVLTVQATAEAQGTAAGDGNFASVRRNTITTTGCSGVCNDSLVAGLVVATCAESANGTVVDVLVIGV